MALVKMWRMDYKLTLLALIPAAVMFGIGTVMRQVMTKTVGGAPAGVLRPVRLCAGEFLRHCGHQGVCQGAERADAFRRLNKENEEINVIYTKIATLLEVLVTLFVESVICVILGYGGWLVCAGSSTRASWWSTSATLRPSSGPSWPSPC